MGLRFLLKVAGALALVPYLIVVLIMLTGSPTWSGVAYLAAIGLLVAALVTLPVREAAKKKTRIHFRGMTRGAGVFLFAIVCVRCCSAGAGETLQFEPSARLVDRLVDERDIALSGTRVLVAAGMFHDDARELPTKMRDAYKQMDAEQGDQPSPVIATYLGLQSASDFDLITITPKDTPNPTDAVIFLHGYAGNFSLPCWQVSRAVADLHMLTACPSTRWVGDWWSKSGEATFRKTVDVLHARGVTKIVLVGLSNGGFGASTLAPKMRGTFAGVVLISGARPDAPSTGVPTLLIHGRHDAMVGIGSSADYVAKHPGAKLLALDAGHFAMLVRSDETNRALHDFCAATLGKTAAEATLTGRSARRSL